MGTLFKTKQEKELEMKLLIQRTVTIMQKQVRMLEAQEKALTMKAEKASAENMEDVAKTATESLVQLNAQLKHAKECLLSYEIAAQIKETTDMTAEFLKTMAIMSKEMGTLTDEKSYTEIEQSFKKSMSNANVQSAHLTKILNLEKRLFCAPVKEEIKENTNTLSETNTPEEHPAPEEDHETKA